MIRNMSIYMEREREAYTEATSGGGDRGGSGYFSSMRPTMTSESGIHLSSNLIKGTLPLSLLGSVPKT